MGTHQVESSVSVPTKRREPLQPVAGPSKRRKLDDEVQDDDEDEPSELEQEDEPAQHKGRKTWRGEKRFACSHEGCKKRYSRESRLKEHERSHTGERPFVCPECSQAYFREIHLKHHMNTHRPDSERPLGCDEPGCTKRFWTSQHLRRHVKSVHGTGFQCDECDKAFPKQTLLRKHVAEEHSPEGTLPFPCTHEGCNKSYQYASKLKTHMKTHEKDRYACAHAECASLPAEQRSFDNWTALQAHNRTAHQPRCPHESCLGRTFPTSAALDAHLASNTHDEEGEDEETLELSCPHPECAGRTFATHQALNGHTRAHTSDKGLSKKETKPWQCPHKTKSGRPCSKSYKTSGALEKHVAAKHAAQTTDTEGETDREAGPARPRIPCDVPGCSFRARKPAALERHKASVHSPPAPAPTPTVLPYACPWPTIMAECDDDDEATREEMLRAEREAVEQPCPDRFARIMDVGRHLSEDHGVEFELDDLKSYFSS